MATDQTVELLSFFSQRVEVVGSAHCGHISLFMCILELFNGFGLLFLFFLGKNFAGGSSQSNESLLGAACLYGFIASKNFRPAFLQKHDPNLIMMGFGIHRIFAFAGETIICCDDLPFAINKQFDCIKVRRVYIEDEPLGDEFRVN